VTPYGRGNLWVSQSKALSRRDYLHLPFCFSLLTIGIQSIHKFKVAVLRSKSLLPGLFTSLELDRVVILASSRLCRLSLAWGEARWLFIYFLLNVDQ